MRSNKKKSCNRNKSNKVLTTTTFCILYNLHLLWLVFLSILTVFLYHKTITTIFFSNYNLNKINYY